MSRRRSPPSLATASGLCARSSTRRPRSRSSSPARAPLDGALLSFRSPLRGFGESSRRRIRGAYWGQLGEAGGSALVSRTTRAILERQADNCPALHRDLVAANLIEAGEKALVLNSGYFGDAFADCFEAYGIKADQLGAPVGGRPAPADIEAALKKEKYAVLTFTHVDTCGFCCLGDAEASALTVASLQPPESSRTRRASRRSSSALGEPDPATFSQPKLTETSQSLDSRRS